MIFVVEVLAVTEQASFKLNAQVLLIVTVRRNRLCPETQSPVIVTFGSAAVAEGRCRGQLNATEMVIPSGDSASFYVDAADISLLPGETICFIVSLDGIPGEFNGIRVSCDPQFFSTFPVISGNASTAITVAVGSSNEGCQSVGLAVGIAVALSLLVVLPVGVVLGISGMWCLTRSRAAAGDKGKRNVAPVLYEEPPKTTIPLTENQAYGQVILRQRTS